jgi:hypothetical protein
LTFTIESGNAKEADAVMKDVLLARGGTNSGGTAFVDTVVLCANCVKPEAASGPKFKQCSSCAKRRYCSRECQRAHWKASHKKQCESQRAKSKDAAAPSSSTA